MKSNSNGKSGDRPKCNINTNVAEGDESMVLYTPPVQIPTVIVSTQPILQQDFASARSSQTTQIITKREIQKSGAKSVSEVLASQNGIRVLDLFGDGSRTTFDLRGFGAQALANTLILVDGQPQTNPDTGAISLDTIAIQSVKEIKWTPSSSSVLYGDQAVGGVIEILTDPDHPKTEKSVSATYGNFNSHQLDVNLNHIQRGQWFYDFQAFHHETDNEREHNQNRDNHIGVGARYQSAEASAYFRYTENHQYLEYPGALTWVQVLQNPWQSASDIPFDSQATHMLQLGGKKLLSSQWQAGLDGNASVMNGNGALQIKGSSSSVRFTERRNLFYLHPKLEGEFSWFNRPISAISGYEIQQGSYEIMQNTNRSLSQSLYAMINISLSAKWKLSVGAREAIDQYHLTNTANTQSTEHASANELEAAYQWNDHANFYIKRAMSYRFPKVDEQTWTFTGQPLKTQTGSSYETGWRGTFARWMVQVSAYRLNLKDEIASVPDARSSYGTVNENLDPTRRIGCLSQLTFLINPQWKVSAGFDAVNPVFESGQFQGKEIPFVAKSMWHANTSYQWREHWNFFAEGIYTGKRYAMNDFENKSGKLGGFTIWNAAVSYNQPLYSIQFRLNNITNKLYFSSVVVTYDQSVGTPYFYPAAGINAMLTFTLRWS